MQVFNIIPLIFALPITLVTHPFIERNIYHGLVSRISQTEKDASPYTNALASYTNALTHLGKANAIVRYYGEISFTELPANAINALMSPANVKNIEDTLFGFRIALSKAFHENEELIRYGGHQLLLSAVLFILIQYTIFGICAQIIRNRIHRGASSVISKSAKLVQMVSRRKVLESVSDNESSLGYRGSDFSTSCTYRTIDQVSDHINPADEREQVLGILENEFSNTRNQSSGYITNIDHGSIGHIRMSCSEPALNLYYDSMSKNAALDDGDIRSLTNAEGDFLASTPRESNSNVKRKESIVSPEKFKKFLQEKHELTEELGITIDENGYLLDNTPEDKPANTSRFGKLMLLRSSLNNSFNLLF